MEEKLIQRLESAVTRLTALSAGSSPAIYGAAAETDPSIVAFDALTGEHLARVSAAAEEIGGQVADATKVLAEAFGAQRELLVQIKQSQFVSICKLLDESPKRTSALLPSTANAKFQTKPSWSGLFKDNRDVSNGIKLEAFDNHNSTAISFAEEDIDDVEKVWGSCLIGYFVGKFPGSYAINQVCKKWNVKYKFFTYPSGWIIFKFDNECDRDGVLKSGPYQFFGRTLLLKMLPRCFEFDDVEIITMPVWATLPGLPLDLWNAYCLGKIMSCVGTPLTTDKLTQTKEQIHYARVLVEVDLSKESVDFVDIKLPNGKVRQQPILYENKPSFCSNCRMLGHGPTACLENKEYTLKRVLATKGKKPISDPRPTQEQHDLIFDTDSEHVTEPGTRDMDCTAEVQAEFAVEAQTAPVSNLDNAAGLAETILQADSVSTAVAEIADMRHTEIADKDMNTSAEIPNLACAAAAHSGFAAEAQTVNKVSAAELPPLAAVRNLSPDEVDLTKLGFMTVKSRKRPTARPRNQANQGVGSERGKKVLFTFG